MEGEGESCSRTGFSTPRLHFELGNFSLCTREYSVASLVSTHRMLWAAPNPVITTKNISRTPDAAKYPLGSRREGMVFVKRTTISHPYLSYHLIFLSQVVRLHNERMWSEKQVYGPQQNSLQYHRAALGQSQHPRLGYSCSPHGCLLLNNLMLQMPGSHSSWLYWCGLSKWNLTTDLVSGNVNLWLRCSFHWPLIPHCESLWAIIFQKSSWSQESPVSTSRNFKFLENFRSEEYNIYIKSKC